MKSRWYSGEGDGGHPPVEMRFVDMFMTALGSLIFIALLLVFLLPQTAQPSNIDTPKLQSELARLRQELAETQAKARQSLQDMEQLFKNVREVDKDVVKRWLSVSLLTKDCPPYEPTLYVRWEGPIFEFATGKRVADMARFDASESRGCRTSWAPGISSWFPARFRHCTGGHPDGSARWNAAGHNLVLHRQQRPRDDGRSTSG